jgi:hypothetical protein
MKAVVSFELAHGWAKEIHYRHQTISEQDIKDVLKEWLDNALIGDDKSPFHKILDIQVVKT